MSQMTSANKCAANWGGGGWAPRLCLRQAGRVPSQQRLTQHPPPRTARYFLHVEPGFDAAFAVALAALVDELFHDQQ